MTIEQHMEQLEFEIERFHRTNRRWRRLACTMVVLIVAAVDLGTAQMNEDELTLRNLVTQAGKGRNRIMPVCKQAWRAHLPLRRGRGDTERQRHVFGW